MTMSAAFFLVKDDHARLTGEAEPLFDIADHFLEHFDAHGFVRGRAE